MTTKKEEGDKPGMRYARKKGLGTMDYPNGHKYVGEWEDGRRVDQTEEVTSSAAAEAGGADAQSKLGWRYLNGLGVPQDYKAALKWLTLAAEQGDANAQHNLGVMYDEGLGVPQDDKTAVEWLSLAAEQGNASAQYNLGQMYDGGKNGKN